MKIFITRHGQTDWNVLLKLQGQTNIELNDVGRKQAEEAANIIGDKKIDLIITSPLNRTKETASIINKKLNVPIIEDKRLTERTYGELEGITREEKKCLKEQYPEANYIWNYDKNVDFKGVEKMQDFCGRVFEFLDEVIEKYNDKNVLLVTHGGTSVPIQYYFNKGNLEDLGNREKIRGLNNCEVAEFDV